MLAPRPYQVFANSPVFNCWAATTSYIAQHADVIKRFEAAMQLATVYANTHQAWLRQTVVPMADKLPAALAGKVTLPTYTTSLTSQDVDVWVNAALGVGLLKKAIPASSVISGP
jgi:NitT/TauT family transport system substrate-binding protein